MFRWMTLVVVAAVAVSAFAQVKEGKACCADKKPVVAQVKKDDCCADKKPVVAQVKKDDCCADKKPVVAQVKKDDCCADKAHKGDDAFMAEAKRMMAMAEAKAGKAECCQSTAEKPMAKGDPGCCNAADAPAKFKVFVAGHGYKFFGCADSAAEGRTALMADGNKVGQVQKVNKARSIK